MGNERKPGFVFAAVASRDAGAAAAALIAGMAIRPKRSDAFDDILMCIVFCVCVRGMNAI